MPSAPGACCVLRVMSYEFAPDKRVAIFTSTAPLSDDSDADDPPRRDQGFRDSFSGVEYFKSVESSGSQSVRSMGSSINDPDFSDYEPCAFEDIQFRDPANVLVLPLEQYSYPLRPVSVSGHPRFRNVAVPPDHGLVRYLANANDEWSPLSVDHFLGFCDIKTSSRADILKAFKADPLFQFTSESEFLSKLYPRRWLVDDTPEYETPYGPPYGREVLFRRCLHWEEEFAQTQLHGPLVGVGDPPLYDNPRDDSPPVSFELRNVSGVCVRPLRRSADSPPPSVRRSPRLRSVVTAPPASGRDLRAPTAWPRAPPWTSRGAREGSAAAPP